MATACKWEFASILADFFSKGITMMAQLQSFHSAATPKSTKLYLKTHIGSDFLSAFHRIWGGRKPNSKSVWVDQSMDYALKFKDEKQRSKTAIAAPPLPSCEL